MKKVISEVPGPLVVLTVAQGDLFKHLNKAGPKGIEGFNIEVLFCCGIEKDVEAGFQAVFRFPVANKNRHLWKRVQDN